MAILACLLAAGRSPAAPGDSALSVLVRGTPHQALFSLAMDGEQGIAVGAAGAILETGDHGTTWRPPAELPTRSGLTGTAMIGNHAIAVGQEGVVLIRTQGRWLKTQSGTKERLFAAAMNSKGEAIAVGAFGTIIRSADFGATWHDAAPDWAEYAKDGVQPHLYDALLDEHGVATVAGEFGLILRDADGGKWRSLHKGEASIFAISVRQDGIGYAVGQNGTMLRTADAGTTWNALQAGTSAILLGVGSDSHGHVIAPGMHDSVVSADDGKSWTHLGGEQFAASWYQGVADAGEGRPWLVAGHSGQLLEIPK